jgi:hypothetical protein
MSAENQPNNLQKRIRAPMGMKLPTAVKRIAAGGLYDDKAARSHYMRTTGIAIHEAALKIKNAAKMQDKSFKSAAVQQAPGARTTIEGASVATEE